MNVEQSETVVEARQTWTLGTALSSALPIERRLPADFDQSLERLGRGPRIAAKRLAPIPEGSSMPSFHMFITGPDSQITETDAELPSAEAASQEATLAATEVAKAAIARGERLAQAEVSVAKDDELVDRRILTISVARDQGPRTE